MEQGGEEEFEALEEAMDVNADVVVTTSVEEEKLTESIELDGAKPDESGEQLEGSESNKKALEPKGTREVAPPTAVANASAGTGRRKKRRKKRNKTQTTMADAVERTESLKLARPIQPLVRVRHTVLTRPTFVTSKSLLSLSLRSLSPFPSLADIVSLESSSFMTIVERHL